MTSDIFYYCVSKEQKKALVKIINYKKKSYINRLIDDIQCSSDVRRDKGYTDTMFDLDFYPDYIDLRKWMDYSTREYVRERYKIYVNGNIKVINDKHY